MLAVTFASRTVLSVIVISLKTDNSMVSNNLNKDEIRECDAR